MDRGSPLRRRLAAAVVLAALFWATGVLADQGWIGRPLAMAIDDLRARGLNVIYSSQLVTQNMTVEAEPTGEDLRSVLDQLLAPHGLATRDGPGGSVLVVAADRREPEPVGALGGVVRSLAEARPLEGATVEVVETGDRAITDSAGRFTVSDLPAGRYTVAAQRTGFLDQSLERIEVAAGQVADIAFELQLLPAFLDEIVVTPSQFSILGADPEARQFLSRSEVERLPHFADDLFRVVPRLPGMANADFTSEFLVRGGLVDETLIMLDGLQIYEPFHFKNLVAFFSTVDSEVVEGVDLMTGGFPVQYGDRMSGVMDIATTTALDAQRTSLGVSFLTARALSEGQFNNGRGLWLVSARRGYLDLLFRNVGGPEPEFVEGPTYYDLVAKVQHQLGSSSVLAANVFASYDEIVYDNPDEDTDFVTKDRGSYAWLNLGTQWNPALFSQTVLSAGRLTGDGEGSNEIYRSSITEIEDERSLRVIGLNQDWTWTLGDRQVLKWGFDVRTLRSEYDYYMHSTVWDPIFTGGGSPIVTEHDFDLSLEGDQFAVYVADRWRLAQGLALELGLRWDRQTWTDSDDQTSPRANLVWELGDGGTLRAAWGRFSQSQGIHQLQVEDGVDVFFPAQTAEHRVLTYERSLAPQLGFKAEVYHKLMTDLRPRYENLLEPFELFPAGAADRVLIEPEKGDARGFELSVKSDGEDRTWSWWAAYSLASVEDLVGGQWQPRNWDQRHALSFSVNWRPGRNWNINLAGTYHSGWPRTPVTTEWIELPDGSLVERPVLGERNSERFPSYFRLDLRASRTFFFAKSSLRFFVEVMNLTDYYNTRSITYRYYPNPDGSLFVEEIEEGLIPFAPSFGVIWEF